MKKTPTDVTAHPVSGSKCPVCHLPCNWEKRGKGSAPFCSPRCQTIDLGKWVGGDYAIAAAAFPGLDPSA